MHADDASYIGTGVVARDVGFDARVHADALRLEITNVTARLKTGGQLEGEVLLDHWIPPLAGAPVVMAAEPAKHEKKGRHKSRERRRRSRRPRSPINAGLPTNGKVTANFRNVTLDTVLDMVSQQPFQRLGLDARFNGPSNAIWTNGDVNTLTVSTNFALSPSSVPPAGESQASGAVEATYSQRNGAVDLRNLVVTMPNSQITARGRLGAYPMSSPTNMTADFHSHNIGEFDTLLRDLGFTYNGKNGAAAVPVALNGQADFHGTWAGSLLDPHLAGTLAAKDLSLEIPSNTGEAQAVHLDSLDASGSYSATRIAIDHGHLQHGDATVSIDGTLSAVAVRSAKSPGLPGFDANSVVRANLHASSVNADDLAPLFGQKLPVSGLVSAQVVIDGPINTPSGDGWVELDQGTIYGEPLTKARAEGKIVGQVVQLASVTMNSAAGTIAGSGSYDLHSRRFQVDAHGSGLDVAKIERLRQSTTALAGTMEFKLSGSGTFDDPHLDGAATISNLAVSGQSLGAISVTAHAVNRSITYDITSRLEAAELVAHGQTELHGDNETRATLNFSQFNIGPLLAMMHVNGLTGELESRGHGEPRRTTWLIPNRCMARPASSSWPSPSPACICAATADCTPAWAIRSSKSIRCTSPVKRPICICKAA